jgi:imidazolonepropionase-like amidohydrolase
MFSAGHAVAFGLTKEQAIQAITLNTAKILGCDDKIGSLEKGKDANIIISSGDILDAKTNNIEQAFVQGQSVDLVNFQQRLYEKFLKKYNTIEISK